MSSLAASAIRSSLSGRGCTSKKRVSVAACCGVILDRLDEPESSSMTRAAKRSTCAKTATGGWTFMRCILRNGKSRRFTPKAPHGSLQT